MQRELEKELEGLQKEVIKRIEMRFTEKFEGNKSAFARACSCDEKTIRKIFNNEQFITVNLAFRICKALDFTMSDLFKGLELK